MGLTLNRMSHIKKPENKFGKVSARKLLSKAASLFTKFIKEDILLTSLSENESLNYASAMKGNMLYFIYFISLQTNIQIVCRIYCNKPSSPHYLPKQSNISICIHTIL